MKPAITSIETAEETFSFDVSDEALEIAAQAKESVRRAICVPRWTGLTVPKLDFGRPLTAVLAVRGR